MAKPTYGHGSSAVAPVDRAELQRHWDEGRRAHLAGDWPTAAKAYEAILAAAPRDRAVAAKAALMAWHFHDPERAKRLLAYYLEAFPEDADQWYNLAKFCQDSGETTEAIAHYQHALVLRPTSVECTTNLALCYWEMGLGAEAEQLLDHAMTLDAQSAEARFNRAFVRLQRGDFAQGWPDYEARFDCASFQWSHERSDLTGTRWKGEALWEGATLLLHTEQGFGDVIQFARFVPRVREMVPTATVKIEVPNELVRLFTAAWPDLEVIPRGVPVGEYDVTASFLSLPAICGVSLDTVPPPVPFRVPSPRLHVDELLAAAQGRPRVGICWAGSKAHPNDRRRSMPDDAVNVLLEHVPNIAWYSLQIGDRERAWLERNPTFHAGSSFFYAGESFRDFADTAALIQRLDFVVTVDTAIAHLAGSLDVPTLLCLHTPSEWRWLKDRTDSPWYPSLRLLRQTTPRSWANVLDEVAWFLNSFSEALAA